MKTNENSTLKDFFCSNFLIKEIKNNVFFFGFLIDMEVTD